MYDVPLDNLNRYHEVCDFVYKAHISQMRHGIVEPYYFHVRRVTDNVINCVGFTPDTTDIINVALMHDVIEDTKHTFEDCFKYLTSQEAKDALVLLTKKEGESGDDYMNRLVSSGNRIALIVKYYDALDNASLTTRAFSFITNELKLNPYEEQQKYLQRAIMCSKALAELDKGD